MIRRCSTRSRAPWQTVWQTGTWLTFPRATPSAGRSQRPLRAAVDEESHAAAACPMGLHAPHVGAVGRGPQRRASVTQETSRGGVAGLRQKGSARGLFPCSPAWWAAWAS